MSSVLARSGCSGHDHPRHQVQHYAQMVARATGAPARAVLMRI